ncbi:hypothetical protein [Streptomyces sp. NPDC001435]|uniref:Mhr22 n=1 Tax=Streptomyces miharaensis TaxID=285483 RepID=A0A4Y5QSF8_9ACTN|nr:Mhr22 [Streptomyces miharaensis]QHD26302.1 phenylalanyl-tRNA synthetase alpha chain [Streptomyces miharaensis]
MPDGLAPTVLTPAVADARCDPGLPPAGPRTGRPHPVAALVDRIGDLFVPLGFDLVQLPLLESVRDNFDVLGYPPDHPTRTRLSLLPAPDVVLRTHATSGGPRAMRAAAPGPLRALLVGTCFRNELSSPYSGSQFTQIDGLVVQPDVGLPELMGLFDRLVSGLFGPGHPWRVRRGGYPFAAPGFAVEVACPRCGPGCDECEGRGHVEIGAGGLLRAQVLTAGGYDPHRVTGLSFGCSVERLLRLSHGLTDIRELLVNDMRLLEQFEHAYLPVGPSEKGVDRP